MPRPFRTTRSLVALALFVAGPGCGDDKQDTVDAGSESASSTSAGSGSSAGTTASTTASSGTDTSATATTSASTDGSATGTTTANTATTDGTTTVASSTTSVDTGETSAGCECGNPEYLCCEGCVDPRNDPNNCGGCGVVCADPTPFCGQGTCQATPCEAQCADPKSCCGGQCCDAGTICCEINGPIQTGPGCVAPSDAGTCPPGCAPLCACAAPDTPIATPEGERPIAALQVGDLVYSVDGEQTVAVPIVEVQRTPVDDHRVVRVVLDDGGVIAISGPHPLGDGRTFAQLAVGDRLGDRRVVEVGWIDYPHAATHDILPASSTGAYFVHGVLVGSTFRPPAPARANVP